MMTTYIDRKTTNKEVLRRAAKATGDRSVFRTMQQWHDNRRVKLGVKLLAAPDTDPGRYCTFEPDGAGAIENPLKRAGRPKIKWATEAAILIWEKHK